MAGRVKPRPYKEKIHTARGLLLYQPFRNFLEQFGCIGCIEKSSPCVERKVVFYSGIGLCRGSCRCSADSADGASGMAWNRDPNEFAATRAGAEISKRVGRESAGICQIPATCSQR